jgi:single stranded DNA-binding protein
MNEVFLLGNLGRDPELRTTESGVPVANCSLATNERFTNKQGDQVERTEWHRLVFWQRNAEVAAESTEVHVQRFQMVGPRTGSDLPASGDEPPAPSEADIPFSS